MTLRITDGQILANIPGAVPHHSASLYFDTTRHTGATSGLVRLRVEDTDSPASEESIFLDRPGLEALARYANGILEQMPGHDSLRLEQQAEQLEQLPGLEDPATAGEQAADPPPPEPSREPELLELLELLGSDFLTELAKLAQVLELRRTLDLVTASIRR